MQEEDAIYPVAVLIDELRNEGRAYITVKYEHAKL